MMLNSLSGLNEKFSFLVHHDTPVLIKAPGTVAPSQAGMFHSIIAYNARYTQPVHGREVQEDSSVD